MGSNGVKQMNESPILLYESNNRNEFLYFDIHDKNLLQALATERLDRLYIGINEQFLKAVNDCNEWSLYQITYAIRNCFSIQKHTNDPSETLSAVGLLKRIVSYKTRKNIKFIYKQHPQIEQQGMKTFKNLNSSNITINLATVTEQSLKIFPDLLKQAFHQAVWNDETMDHIVVKLISVPLIERKLVIRCMIDTLKEIEETMLHNREMTILIRKKITNSMYTICDIRDYAPAKQLLEYDHRSVMEHMLEASEDRSLLLSI
ncbi:MAG TPA: hypothetical protein H9895_11535 [Candidatus Pseudogracilibacillus intestinigallinarum]|uniref:Uncharacterized protein n=1 Tax=Candidatus Pseudogracilibacillus intestinigallinarum TaxID=2838742 RepID=A0A9D1PPQ8_9BACI|nr:hypothetical protein [Candidatus Pseudogracilibacillus intestinigallinarum]